MREKELRIALVCFGGVSLAVYMHGISKEILKLVRASSALHAHLRPLAARAGVVLRPRRSQRSRIRHRGVLFRAAARDRPQHRTARRRRHHRRRVGRRHQRHHAGARAEPRPADGGAARPVARQCRRRRCCCRPTRAPAPGASGSCKPFLWGAAKTGMLRRDQGPGGAPEAVAVRALALVQAAARRAHHGRPDVRRRRPRWASREHPRASLLPSGQSLDLFVTLTDYLRLPPARADPRSAADPRARPPPRAAVHLSAAVERRGRKRLRPRQRAGARLRRARDLVVPGRLSAGADRGDGRGAGRSGTASWPRRAEFIANERSRNHLRADIDPATASVHRRLGAQQPAVPAGDLGDPRPAGLSARSTAGWSISIRIRRRRCARRAHNMPGLLRDAARRAVGYSELAAGDRRAQLGASSSTSRCGGCGRSSTARVRRSAGWWPAS